MAELFEIGMILCFGISWPMNLYKSYKSRTAKGTSFPFLCLIEIGYVSGIISKFVNDAYMREFATKWYVLIFYFINLVFVSLNIIVYFRNKRIDEKGE